MRAQGTREELGGDEDDREPECLSDGDGVRRGGIRDGKDGATSGARHDSKRVDTQSLAENMARLHERYKRKTSGVPEPPALSSNDHRQPIKPVDPLRRRGSSRRNLEISVGQNGHTKSNGRVRTISSESQLSDAMYME